MKRTGLIVGGLAAVGIGAAVFLGGSKKAHAKPGGGGGGSADPDDESAKKAGELPGAPMTAGPLPPGSNDQNLLGMFTEKLARTAMMSMGYAIDPDFRSALDPGEVETFAAGYNLVSKYGGGDLEIFGNDGQTVIATYRIPGDMGFVNVDSNMTDAKRAALHLAFLVSLDAVNDPGAAAGYMADLAAFVNGSSDLLMDTDWKLIVLEAFLREQVAAGVYDSLQTAHLMYNPGG